MVLIKERNNQTESSKETDKHDNDNDHILKQPKKQTQLQL